MKKIILSLLLLSYSFSTASAIGINLGVSVTGGVFEAKGAKEEFKGAHMGGTSPGTVTKNTQGQDEAEGDFVLGSLFIEKTLGDRFAIGLDYVSHSADTETSENTQTTSTSSATGVNKVQVDFEDLTTLYATFSFTESIYVKAGVSSVDVITNEVLATGGSYGNTSLDGTVFGIGYNKDLDSGTFVRLEANYMDFDGATLTNTADTTKSVTADGFDGYGARISIGKSF